MDFFQKHDKALRKGRLLQAAATLLAGFKEDRYITQDELNLAVNRVFRLEKEIEKELELRG